MTGAASLNVIVIAGLSDKKLQSKIRPLMEQKRIRRMHLVRNAPLPAGEPVVNINPPGWCRNLFPVNECFKIIRLLWLCVFGKIDLIIGAHYEQHGMYAAFLGLFFKKPYVLMMTEDPAVWGGRPGYKKHLRKAAAVIARGNRSAAYLQKCGVASDRIFIISNIVEAAAERRAKEADKQYDLIFVGNLIKEKRVDWVLKAAANMTRNDRPVKTAVVGEGSEKQNLIRLAGELGIASRTDFTGFVRDVDEHLNRAKVLALPSETEGLPMVVLEAMGCGVPSVVTDVGDVRDWVCHEGNGMIVPNGDFDCFNRSVESILADADLLVRLSDGARESYGRIMKFCTVSTTTEQWASVLCRVDSSE